MRNSKSVLLSVLLLGAMLLSACGSSANTNTDAVLTEAAQIAFQALTETAAAAPPTATFTPVPPTPTFTPEPPTLTPTLEGEQPPTATSMPVQQQPSTSGVPCLRASLEWESHPDGAQIYANTPFVKTWRIKNSGSCTWKRDFVAIWVQGELMGADTVVEFSDKEIAPGEYAMIEVSMRAPDRSGFYKGYWMLRGDGAIFGIGTSGREWFWVDVEILPVVDED